MTAQTTLGQFDSGYADLTAAEREMWEEVEEGPYGPREYARETDRSPGTVSNLLRRAREKMEGSP